MHLLMYNKPISIDKTCKKHLIKQVFVAIWMRWLVERRKKIGNLYMKSIIETVFLCVCGFLWGLTIPTTHFWLNFVSFSHTITRIQPYQTEFEIFSFGSVTSYYLKFSFSYSVISKNNSACVNIFLNFQLYYFRR